MENLKKALSVCVKVAEKSFEAMEDGKVTVSEGVNIGMSALGFIGVVRNFPTIKDEYLNLTAEQKIALSEWFAEEFDIVNDSIEAVVEQVINVLINLGEVFEFFKK